MGLGKLERFLEVSRKAWAEHADLVQTQAFFERWQEADKPRPFAVTDDTCTLAGQTVTWVPDGDRVGYVTWDMDEMRPVLVVEGQERLQRLYLGLADGEPLLESVDPVLLDDDELGLGERMEVVYDIVEYLRRTSPGRHLLAVTVLEFRTALEAVADRHRAQAVTVMRQVTAGSLQRLLRRAAEDIPADELSQQLELPFGGTYGPAVATPARETAPERLPGPAADARCRVAGRTRWAAEQDVEFVARGQRRLAEVETDMVFDLRGTTVLEPGGERTCPVVAVATGGLPVLEGDRLQVFRRGERGQVSQLLVDLVDGPTLYGRLEWSAVDGPLAAALPDLYARRRGGPAHFLAGCLDALLADLRRAPAELPPALRAALGLNDFEVSDPAAGPTPPAHFDPTQVRAWRQAVSPDNPVVLIQGPPGTGKTSVLEQVLRTLCRDGRRVLMTAPSNTAVDNACRRAVGLPVLRFGVARESIAPDVADTAWIGDLDCVRTFARARQELAGGGLFAGTPVGLLRGEILAADMAKSGPYDVLVIDEAGMIRLDEFLLVCRLARRVVLFGDHQQLPPFPLPDEVTARLREDFGAVPRHLWATVRRSALEWLAGYRRVPVVMLQRSYRCQNPRLLRFSSTLFYDARVKPREDADYFRLSYAERQARYPAATLRLYRTSRLPLRCRHERFVLDAGKPGLENELEARLCLWVVRDLLARFPLQEITVIAPYRRQVRLLRGLLEHYRDRVVERAAQPPADDDWRQFLHARVATVDSFQGGESDAVVVCYVRSNADAGIGFVDAPNRVNVAHTRCRREMVVIADSECLCRQANSRLFIRMERAFGRDGEIVDVDETLLAQLPRVPKGLGTPGLGLTRGPGAAPTAAAAAAAPAPPPGGARP